MSLMKKHGLKRGDPVPLSVAVKMAQMIPANKVGANPVGSVGRAFSPRLLALRAKEAAEKKIEVAVAEALAKATVEAKAPKPKPVQAPEPVKEPKEDEKDPTEDQE